MPRVRSPGRNRRVGQAAQQRRGRQFNGAPRHPWTTDEGGLVDVHRCLTHRRDGGIVTIPEPEVLDAMWAQEEGITGKDARATSETIARGSREAAAVAQQGRWDRFAGGLTEPKGRGDVMMEFPCAHCGETHYRVGGVPCPGDRVRALRATGARTGGGVDAPPEPISADPPLVPEKSSGLAIASLVLGICSFLRLGTLCSIPGIITGHKVLSRIRRDPFRLSGKGMAISGLILSYVNLMRLWRPSCCPPARAVRRHAGPWSRWRGASTHTADS